MRWLNGIAFAEYAYVAAASLNHVAAPAPWSAGSPFFSTRTC